MIKFDNIQGNYNFNEIDFKYFMKTQEILHLDLKINLIIHTSMYLHTQ